MNSLKDKTQPVVTGIIVSEFHAKIGPRPILFTPVQMTKDHLDFVALKTIDYLEGIIKIPDRILIFEFPLMQKKGLVKFYNWTDSQLRGGTGIGSVTVLYNEKDDPVIYKFRKDFEKPLQEFSESLIRLKSEKGDDTRLKELLHQFEDQMNSLINELGKRELDTSEAEFPDQAKSTHGPVYIIKCIVLGDPSVGKTSLILQYTDKAFHRSYIPTLGTNITEKKVPCKDRVVQLVIWDIAGQVKFTSIRHQFYKGAAAVVLTFDLTDLSSFQNLTKWYNDLKSTLEDFETVALILCGNKADLQVERKVPQNQIDEFSSKYETPYFEISSLTGQNVEDAFNKVVELILKRNF